MKARAAHRGRPPDVDEGDARDLVALLRPTPDRIGDSVRIAVVVAIFATIAVFMLSLSEPALRIPLMAVMTFASMFLARAATLGPVFFVAGFVIAYGLTLGDEVLGLALQ